MRPYRQPTALAAPTVLRDWYHPRNRIKTKPRWKCIRLRHKNNSLKWNSGRDEKNLVSYDGIRITACRHAILFLQHANAPAHLSAAMRIKTANWHGLGLQTLSEWYTAGGNAVGSHVIRTVTCVEKLIEEKGEILLARNSWPVFQIYGSLVQWRAEWKYSLVPPIQVYAEIRNQKFRIISSTILPFFNCFSLILLLIF